MKSYTDLEQSKRLADMLPLESVDMSWVEKGNAKRTWYDAENRRITTKYEKKYYIPCWSLAALLELLPNGSQLNKSSNGRYFFSGILYDNPIDACVNEIEVLIDTGNLKFNKEE